MTHVDRVCAHEIGIAEQIKTGAADPTGGPRTHDNRAGAHEIGFAGQTGHADPTGGILQCRRILTALEPYRQYVSDTQVLWKSMSI